MPTLTTFRLLAGTLWPLLAMFVFDQALHAQTDRPNIVLIMADDMGFTDIGCYGSEIKTPVLDQLAANGLRFSQFYNTSRCCPTRASLLTGMYPHQTGVGLMTSDRGYDAYRGDLNRKSVTLAEVLSMSGYRNYMSGKWHVTRHFAPDSPIHNWPLQRGFDRFYGTIIGAGSFFDPTTLCRGNQYITPENDPDQKPDSFYYTDAISNEAVRFIKEHNQAHSKAPFFLYVAYTSAHWPMHAPESDIEKYAGKYDEGFEPIRAKRLEKARQQGVLDRKWEMTPADASWENVKDKPWDIRNMEVYAAMVDRMDQGIGKIVEQLDAANQLDNTLIIYLQDNGGCAEPFGRESNADEKAKFDLKPFGPDDLQPKIWPPMQTRDGRWVRTGPGVMAGAEDTFVAYGKGWANVSNTPFAGYKHDSLEGGISTPFIVHWPKGIDDDQKGRVVDFPSHLIDVMPTLVTTAGAKYPGVYEGEKIQPMEGVDLLPTLTGKTLSRDEPLAFEHHGNLALREGQWKVVSKFPGKDKPRVWQLFDMQSDRTELNDLSEQHPEKKLELIAKWQRWAERVGVQEWPFPNKQPKQILFDGRTFSGWNGDTEGTWRIQDEGFVAGSLEKAAPRNEFLCTDKRYSDFELSLQFKVAGTERINCGVQFRTERIPDHHEVIGYQADIGDGVHGCLYDESRRRKFLAKPDKATTDKVAAAIPADGWQRYRIRAVGNRIQLWVNGIQTVDFEESDAEIAKDGVLALQIHGRMIGTIAYRNIELIDLSQ